MAAIPGRIIRAWREERGWSVLDLALAAAMTPDYLTRVESDEVGKVHTRTYQKLADALSVSLDELATDPEDIRKGDLISQAPESLQGLIRVVLVLVLVCGSLFVVAAATGVLAYGYFELREWAFPEPHGASSSKFWSPPQPIATPDTPEPDDPREPSELQILPAPDSWTPLSS